MIPKTVEKTMHKLVSMTGSERIDFMVENMDAIIEQKKMGVVKSAPVSYRFPVGQRKAIKSKSEILDSETIEKTLVGNVAMYMDTHLDVQGEGCWKRSLDLNQANIFHNIDHGQKVADRVGMPIRTYTKTVDVNRLGFDSNIKKAEALMMDSTIYKALNEKVFTQYSLGMINQHSVEMVYIKVDLALNEDTDETKKEFKLWEKIFPKLINPETAERHGMFFYVRESKLLGISGVTRGSNDLTPVWEEKTDPAQATPHEEKRGTAEALRETNKNNFYQTLLK